MTRRIAVIADAHLTDLHGGYGLFDPAQGRVALRSAADSFGSTRLFNESRAALVACLGDIAARGIREVVLLGDMTDDGQPGALAALRALLDEATARHGLRFHALLGNHDAAGPGTRPVPARLFDAAGAALPEAPGQIMMSEAEMCRGLARHGFDRPALWAGDRSYLVQLPDVWLLLLDANVFDTGGTLVDRPAWDAVLTARPGLLTRIAETVRAAEAAGVPLVAFSHYPMIAFPRGPGGALAPRYWRARMPSLATTRALAATGLRCHVSGHLHLANRARVGGLTNVAMPSPVSFPGGYGLLTVTDRDIVAERTRPGPVAGFDVASALYGAECAGYEALLDRHFEHLVRDFYLPRDLPGTAARPEHMQQYRRIAAGLPLAAGA